MELPIITRREQSPESRGTYAFVSLGCPKNLVDSERMLGRLTLDGYTPVSDPDGADFVVVNTCGFIDSSRAESRSVIDEMLELKREGKTGGVIVAGCLPERVGGDSLLQEFPEIDHVVGVFGREEISKVADRILGNVAEQRELFRPAPIKADGEPFLDDRGRLRITPAHFAYLKISEGCNRNCAFCSIPSMRGRHISKPIEQIVAEATELANDGARELVIVAQDTTFYGIDLYRKARLVDLLKELEQVEGVDWIRLMYLYPINFSDELIDLIAGSAGSGGKILPYLDMPLQHINDEMLRSMRRRVGQGKIEELVARLRERIPNLVLRTTFITGFPGETDAQFEDLVNFVDRAAFERVGVFPYSIEPGTPAAEMPQQLPEEIKNERRDRLMETQQKHAFAFGDSLVGYEIDVVLDEEIEPGVFEGRSFADAPEIDGTVFVAVSEDLSAEERDSIGPGKMVPVEIVRREDYDLVGVVNELPK